MKLEEFEKEILPLRDKLFRIALRITCNREEAEDITQDVMLKMWQIRDEWNVIENKEAYCCMISRNLALGRMKLKENQTKNMEDPEVLTIQTGTIPSVALEQEERRSMLRNLIARLPEKERSVMQLRDLEEMSYKEVAQVLELTEAQVKINLFRARQKIKGILTRMKEERIVIHV